MATWQRLGMNYGHQISSSSYNTTQIENDFTYLQSRGITRLRIVMPQFDGSSTTINNCKDTVTRALNHGFYVIWGVVAGFGAGTITATRWASFKTYITGTLAPWAQSNGLSELCLGNENEFATDGTTLTNATMRSDTRAMATTVKSGGFTGKVSYSTTVLSTYRNPWASEGIGDLDLIGFNSYDVLANFNANKPTLVSQFGNTTYISEFGSITNGQSDYANETAYYTDVIGRINSMQNAGIQWGYFFCFRDGSFGVPTNSFGLVQTKNTANWAHYALKAISGKRLYAPRAFGSPVQFGLGLMNAVESVQPSESVTLSGMQTLAAETVSPAEAVSQLNLTQILESVLLSETIALTAPKKYALRAFGGPIRYGIRRKYALRAFGGPVLYTVNVHATNLAAESVLPSEALTLTGISTLAPEPVQLSEIATMAGQSQVAESVLPSESLASTGQSQFTDGVFLSEYSTPNGFMSITDLVSVSENLSLSGTSSLALETVQLSEVTSLLNTAQITDIVQLSENTSLVGGTQIIDNAALSELIALQGSSQFIESVQLSEALLLLGFFANTLRIKKYAPRAFGGPAPYYITSNRDVVSLAENISLQGISTIASEQVSLSDALSFAGTTQIVEAVQLGETLILVGTSQITAESVSISDILSLTNITQIIDNVQLAEAMSFASSIQIIENISLAEIIALKGYATLAPETVQISDLISLLGNIQITDAIQLSEILNASFFPSSNITFYVRDGKVLFYVRDGQTKMYSRGL